MGSAYSGALCASPELVVRMLTGPARFTTVYYYAYSDGAVRVFVSEPPASVVLGHQKRGKIRLRAELDAGDVVYIVTQKYIHNSHRVMNIIPVVGITASHESAQRFRPPVLSDPWVPLGDPVVISATIEVV